MADISHTVAADENGTFEFPIAAGTVVVVQVLPAAGRIASPQVEAINHGSVPLYVRSGTDVAPQSPYATAIGPGMADDFDVADDGSCLIALTAAADITASVQRRRRR